MAERVVWMIEVFGRMLHVAPTVPGAIPCVPAPRWTPIAQLPDSWRDGRSVVVSQLWDDDTRTTHCVTFDGYDWSDGEFSYEPDMFLDIAIPEVPRG